MEPYQKKLADALNSKFLFPGTRSYRDTMSAAILKDGKKGDRVAIVSPDRTILLKITEVRQNETDNIQGSEQNIAAAWVNERV